MFRSQNELDLEIPSNMFCIICFPVFWHSIHVSQYICSHVGCRQKLLLYKYFIPFHYSCQHLSHEELTIIRDGVTILMFQDKHIIFQRNEIQVLIKDL